MLHETIKHKHFSQIYNELAIFPIHCHSRAFHHTTIHFHNVISPLHYVLPPLYYVIPPLYYVILLLYYVILTLAYNFFSIRPINSHLIFRLETTVYTSLHSCFCFSPPLNFSHLPLFLIFHFFLFSYSSFSFHLLLTFFLFLPLLSPPSYSSTTLTFFLPFHLFFKFFPNVSHSSFFIIHPLLSNFKLIIIHS